MMTVLMEKTACQNLNQFGARVNNESERLGWNDTQQSNKWYKLTNGSLTKRPDKPIAMLDQLFHCAEQVYEDGPANLWRALWGDATNPAVLWPLCRTRIDSNGPWLDDISWKEIEAKLCDEKPFCEAIREFEGELLLAMAYDQPLSLNHLTESIALYRLHQTTNCLARSDVDGVGAYRCIRLCLDDPGIASKLTNYSALNVVRVELIEMEIGRLTRERSYLASVGVQRHQIELYAKDPLPWIDDNARWDALNLDWAGANQVIAFAGGSTNAAGSTPYRRSRRRLSAASAEEILTSAHYNKLSPGRPTLSPRITPSTSGSNVVHMRSWVKDKVVRR
ncbi:hypothetical protein QFZ99_002923 [Paraburkholderia atlantica]|uniref:hypothetical protein n=1 Tax=Paraburkholderia atlantica TaxID=2654982 RepID=UPI003D19B257